MTSFADDDISSCLTGDMITLYVGPKNKRYSVHKALLVKYKWFRMRIHSLIIQDHFNFLSEDPKVFELLISWLYRKKFNAISTTDEVVAKDEAMLSVYLYLRACVWEIHELQNALIDRLRVRQTCEYGFFPRTLIKKIYENTESQSPLRSYIVDSFIFKGIRWNPSGLLSDPSNNLSLWTRKLALKTQLDAGNQAFVLDCYEALFQLCAKSKIRDPDRKTGCVYHEHKEGEKCVK